MKQFFASKKLRTVFAAAGLVLLLFAAGTLTTKLATTRLIGNSGETGGKNPGYQVQPGEDEYKPSQKMFAGNAKNLKEPIATEDLASREVSHVDGALPPLRDKAIKMGSMTLKVKRNKFGSAYDQIVMLAKTNGGYVAGSNSSSSNDRLVSGTVTIRVPSDNFEQLTTKVRGLGKITALNINSQDVSSEYVDLESRLRHWRSQETVMLKLMDKADSITDSITIQQQLAQI